MTEIRFATFNIRNGRAFDGWHSWPLRRAATVEAIRSLDAHVVGLQEVYGFQLRWLTARLPRYGAVGEGRGGRCGPGEHCPVLADREALNVVDAATLWYGTDPSRPGSRLDGARFPRIATVCRIATASGTMLQLACTHLDATSALRRRRSLEQLVGWLDPALPHIVLGDLNAEPADDELAPLREAGLRDALGSTPGGTAHRFTGATEGPRIDHLFVSDDIEVVQAAIAHSRPGGRLPSDHWPVVVTARLPG